MRPLFAGFERNVPILRRFALPGITVLSLSIYLAAHTPKLDSLMTENGISQAAADSCEAKVRDLEANASHTPHPLKRATRISEEEINSLFALKLKPKYHPSLKSIRFGFESSAIRSTAIIDFDALSVNSTKTFTKLIAKMFSGVHQLDVHGRLIADARYAHFELIEARFDNSGLPNFLVEQVITAVGRKQKPPFDPLQPTQMPYSIQKVEVRAGYILIYQ